MNAKPVAYPILGHKHSKERGGFEPPRPLQPPDITGNHLPILDTTILTDFRLHACTVTIIYYQF